MASEFCSIKDCDAKEGLISCSDLQETERLTLSLRSEIENLDYICTDHRTYFGHYFELKQKNCCDPLKKHRKKIKNHLSKLKLDNCLKLKHVGLHLVPGKLVCNNCLISLRNLIHNDTLGQIGDIMEADYSPDCRDEDEIPGTSSTNFVIESLNSSLGSNISPIKTLQGISSAKKQNMKKRKLESVVMAADKTLSHSLKIASSFSHDNSLVSMEKKAQYFEEMINKIRSKVAHPATTRSEKVQLLTILPQEMSREEIIKRIGVSKRMVDTARELDVLSVPPVKKVRGITADVKEVVVQFYCDDEHTRLLPGQKDRVSVGRKVYEQKRLILVTLQELYVMFKAKYPHIKIGRSMFCMLRPKWCKSAGSSGTHQVCVCAIHENTKLMLLALNADVSYNDLIAMLVCDVTNRDCMLSKCSACPGPNPLIAYLHSLYDDEQLEITFKQWTAVDRTDLTSVTLPIDDYLERLVEKVKNLAPHSYIAKQQAAYLKERKEKLDENEVLCLMDFSENYSFHLQNEVQGFHWTHKSATVHPVVCYYRQNGQLDHVSLCFLSDRLEHDVAMVYEFQKRTISFLKQKIPSIEKVEYFTDGCAGQYKNCRAFYNLCLHADDFGVFACHSFFATSHGKSACDVIGGSVKRSTANESLRRGGNDPIICIDDMLKHCQATFSTIHFEAVVSEEMSEVIDLMEARKELSKTIKGTRSFHSFVPLRNGKLACKRLSSDAEPSLVVQILKNNITRSFSIGQYIAAIFDTDWYIGVIEDIDGDNSDAYVNFMHPSGPAKSYHWPVRSDRCWVPLQHILCEIACPTLQTSRGQHQITAACQQNIQSKFIGLE